MLATELKNDMIWPYFEEKYMFLNTMQKVKACFSIFAIFFVTP